VSVAQYLEIYISNKCLFGRLTAIKHFGTTADVKGLREYGRRQNFESVCFRIKISTGCF